MALVTQMRPPRTTIDAIFVQKIAECVDRLTVVSDSIKNILRMNIEHHRHQHSRPTSIVQSFFM